MNFISDKQLLTYINNLKYISEGSQGACYQKENTVIKIFHDYIEEEKPPYTKEDILKYSQIKNKTFIWPKEVIEVKDQVVGYTMPYIKMKNLYKTNPLLIDLTKLEEAIKKSYEDIKLVTDKNITMYDVAYNILYKNGQIKIIDTIEYTSTQTTYEKNRMTMDYEIKLFLIDNYFNNFINNNIILKEMYEDNNVSSLELLITLRKELSTYLDKDINKLQKAKKLIKRIERPKYIREIEGDEYYE